MLKYSNIHVFRGLAAISVLLWHLHSFIESESLGNNPSTYFKIITPIFSYGAFLFFVISGFLMAQLVDTEYPKFLIKRILRIYPLFFIVLTLTIIIKIIVFGGLSQPGLLSAMSLMPSGQIQYVLGIEWTLVFEVFFYIICSIFTVKTLKLKNYFNIFLVIWLSIILINSYYTLIGVDILVTYPTIFFSPFNILFIAGGLLYYMEKIKIDKPLTFGIISFGFLGVSDYIVFERTEHKIILIAIGFACLLHSTIRININNKHLNIFGDNSYALYLIHVPVITILITQFQKIDLPITSAIGLVLLIVSLVIGHFFGKLDLSLQKAIKNYLR